MIRKAVMSDIDSINQIYEHIHALQEQGHITTGWVRGVYPTLQTARAAVASGEMYVYEKNGVIIASGRINHVQGEEYRQVPWSIDAADDRVLVLHTLVVDPLYSRQGIGKAFIAYYESLAKELDCLCLRIDTNERNARARKLYQTLGYRECAVVPCIFNGIRDVRLVCLEKLL